MTTFAPLCQGGNQTLERLANRGSQNKQRENCFGSDRCNRLKPCVSNHYIALISHASKVMLKILEARLQQYMNRELPHVEAGFRKGRGTRDQIANILWIIEKAREFQKNIYFCFID